ncbi:hypothetical protein GIB19_20740 [Pseudomonas sp. ITEM 17296]|jgi:hypothetical protein|uniref:hypothetical protein n=1 Tax=Pseudomonas sp. ITEM 17296 TaxID=2790281 RepID=UPI000C1248BF|nr:hypothetical protein [Pseudomonas sp. ITEM 17296]ATP49150.1 hypothetical protein CR512_07150 [Pseudomonas putida]MDE4539632.1 hypothetical protein [Pseudomonas sp. ITEM 17296]GLO57269.1 hypothetical protein PPUJ20066_33050 [Pseudomonas putida]
MKTNAHVLSMLFAGLLIGGGVGQTVQASETQAAAIIKFAQRMDGDQHPGGKQCSVTVPAAGADAKQFKMDGCGNDVATYVKFENVPSSTIVTLISERSCSYSGDWWFDVRAIKHPTSSLWFDIRKLKDAVDTIIVPGVMRTTGEYDHGTIAGKLSCAVIRSPRK